MLGLGAVMRFPPQPSFAIQAQYAGAAFEPHLAHGAARIAGDVLVEPVAVEQSSGARVVFEHDVAGILAGDDRVEPAQPRVDRTHLTHEETEGVDPVDRGLVDQ